MASHPVPAERVPVTPPADPGDRYAGSAPEAPLAAWMAAAQRGDEQAYRLFLLAIMPLLRHTARRLEDPAAIEDAIQDTLRTIHLLRHTHQPERAIRPWVAAIAERHVAERLRRAPSRLNDDTRGVRRPFQTAGAFVRDLLAVLRRKS